MIKQTKKTSCTTISTLRVYLDFDSSNDNLDEEDKEEGEISSDEDEAISSNESKGETAAPVKLVDYESISSEDDQVFFFKLSHQTWKKNDHLQATAFTCLTDKPAN